MEFIRNYAEEWKPFMTPDTETESELIARLIRESEPKRLRQLTGQEYYDNIDTMTGPRYIPTKRGFELANEDSEWNILSNFHANQVDHKVSYLLGNPINFKASTDKEQRVLGRVFDFKFDDLIIDVATSASNKGDAWIHPYYNRDGVLSFKHIPTEQIVPKYDDEDELEYVIRFYVYDGEYRAELWTPETVAYYVKTPEGFVPDYYYGEDYITSHFSEGSWGRVPFVRILNNSQAESDIWKYKSLIDAYNRSISNLQKTFDEATSTILILEGYEGQDLDEFKDKLKKFGVVKVGNGMDGKGDVRKLEIKIPMEETKAHLQLLREAIVDFGRGVDFQSDKFGYSPSGVALRQLFSNLDMKAKQMERKLRVAISELLWFVYESENIDEDFKDVEMTFSYNSISNDYENAQIAVISKGIISDSTIIANHPWTDDIQGEEERLAEQLLNIQALPEEDL